MHLVTSGKHAVRCCRAAHLPVKTPKIFRYLIPPSDCRNLPHGKSVVLHTFGNKNGDKDYRNITPGGYCKGNKQKKLKNKNHGTDQSTHQL